MTKRYFNVAFGGMLLGQGPTYDDDVTNEPSYDDDVTNEPSYDGDVTDEPS